MSRGELAKIRSTFLGVEDHGLLTCMLYVDYEGGDSQGVGGYCLDDKPGDDGERHGTAEGMEMVRRIISTVGAKAWEDLPGHMIRVVKRDDGMVLGISSVSFGTGSTKTLLFSEVFGES